MAVVASLLFLNDKHKLFQLEAEHIASEDMVITLQRR